MHRAVSASKRSASKKQKQKQQPLLTWKGCIAFRGKGKDRQGLLVWRDENLRETNCCHSATSSKDFRTIPKFRLTNWCSSARTTSPRPGPSWTLISPSSWTCSPRSHWRSTASPKCLASHGGLCTFRPWTARSASSTSCVPSSHRPALPAACCGGESSSASRKLPPLEGRPRTKATTTKQKRPRPSLKPARRASRASRPKKSRERPSLQAEARSASSRRTTLPDNLRRKSQKLSRPPGWDCGAEPSGLILLSRQFCRCCCCC